MAPVSPTALRGLAESWVPADDGRELFAELAAHLRSIVPFDGSAWFATDPSSAKRSLVPPGCARRTAASAPGTCLALQKSRHRLRSLRSVSLSGALSPGTFVMLRSLLGATASAVTS